MIAGFSLPQIELNDVLDIIIISIIIYQVIKWAQLTRAWTLFKGIVVLLVCALFASLLQLHTISWLLSNSLGVGITALMIIFQPELRRGPDCPDDFRSYEPDSRAGADQAQRPERMQGSLHSHPQ